MDQQISANTVSAAYTQNDHLSRQTDRYAMSKYKMTQKWLAPFAKQGQTLFNIGCGNGQFNEMAADLGLSVVGYEPDPETLKLAKSLSAASKRYESQVRLSSQGLFEITEKADYIVMHDVLEHIEDDVAAVGQLRNILQPGGRGIISVPALPWLFGYHDEQLGHFRRYTSASLRSVLETHFEIEKIRYFGASFIPIVYWFSVSQRKSYPYSAASNGLPSKILSGLCSAEEQVPLPLGTSVMAQVRLKG